MVKVNYKYVVFGEKFNFEGKEYIKTNFGRAYYCENGKKIFRKFKKRIIVDTKHNLWDVVPPIK